MIKHKQIRWIGLCTIALLALGACDGQTRRTVSNNDKVVVDDKKPGVKPDTKTPSLLEPTMEEKMIEAHADLVTEGHGQLVPEELINVRQRRRLDVDQLDESIQRVTGGIAWTEMQGNREVNLFQSLSRTLGKPDYIQETAEDLEPSLIFQKFLGDAARSVCDKLANRELDDHRAERHLMVHVDPSDTMQSDAGKIDKNIQTLLLNFHGRYVPDGDPQLGHWRWLFESSHHISNDPAIAWRTVCVGLITHPDFYTY